MYRLQKWLRRRRDGGSAKAEPSGGGADLKHGDIVPNASSLGPPQRGRQPAAPPAVGHSPRPGDRPAGPFSVAAGAGVLPAAGPASGGAGAAPPLPAAATAATATRQGPLERTSSHSSRHDSSRSFSAGDCLTGLEGGARVGKGVPGELDPSRVSAHTDCSSGRASESNCAASAGGNDRSARQGAAGSAPEGSPAVRGSLAALGSGRAAAGAAADARPAAPDAPPVSTTAAAAASSSDVEPPPTPAALPTASRSPHVPPPPPPRQQQQQQVVGGIYATRALFESYHEREVEQRLRQAVFGSFQQRASASRPIPPLITSCTSYGGLVASSTGAPVSSHGGSGGSGGGGAPSLELAHLRSPAGAVAAVAAGWGGGDGASWGGDGGSGGSGMGHVGPAATQWGIPYSAQSPGQPYIGSGGMAALSARDLLLGRTTSALPYRYDHVLHCHAVAAAGLEPAAQPPLFGACSVPAPPRPPLEGSILPRPVAQEAARQWTASAQASAAPQQVQGAAAAAAAATSAAAEEQRNEPTGQQREQAQQVGVAEIPGTGPGSKSQCPSGPGLSLQAASNDETQGPEVAPRAMPAGAPCPSRSATDGGAGALEAVSGPGLSPAPASSFSFHVRPTTALVATGQHGGAVAAAAATAVSQPKHFGPSCAGATATPAAAVSSSTNANDDVVAAATAVPAPRAGSSGGAAAVGGGGSDGGAADACGSLAAAPAARSRDRSGGGDGGPQPSTLAAVLACLAVEDPSQNNAAPQSAASPLPPPPQQRPQHLQPQPQSQHSKPQSPLLWRFPQSQPPKAWPQQLPPPPPPLLQQQQLHMAPQGCDGAAPFFAVQRESSSSASSSSGRRASPACALHPGGEATFRPVGGGEGGRVHLAQALAITGWDGAATATAAAAVGRSEGHRSEAAPEAHNAALPAAGAAAPNASEELVGKPWGWRRSGRSACNAAGAADGADSAAAGVAAALARQASGSPGDGDARGDGEAASFPSQLRAGLRATAAGLEEAAPAVEGLTQGAAQAAVGPSLGLPLQGALMAPRLWPASGAAGPEGPLARCVAERLMTRNPLFRLLEDGSCTPEGLDSGNEDEG